MAIKIALAGNPNCGKTTMFNDLTGATQYVGNWPGVTVEKKEGKFKGDKDAKSTLKVAEPKVPFEVDASKKSVVKPKVEKKAEAPAEEAPAAADAEANLRENSPNTPCADRFSTRELTAMSQKSVEPPLPRTTS